MGDVISFPKPLSQRGGGCPVCGNSDGFLNVESNHYGTCDNHLTYWWIGSNLFSSWKEETRETWQKNIELLRQRRRTDGGAHPELSPVDSSSDEFPFQVRP